MGIEEDLANAIKYANFSGGKGQPNIDLMGMMQAMLNGLEVSMLTQMDSNIRARLEKLRPQRRAEKGIDPFIILGVDINSTKEEVEKAYKEKAWKAHPDHGGTTEDMVKVNAAFEAISLFKGWKKR